MGISTPSNLLCIVQRTYIGAAPYTKYWIDSGIMAVGLFDWFTRYEWWEANLELLMRLSSLGPNHNT